MPPRKKKVVQKRTPGFTTIDKEVHDLLDTVRPVAERVYRKLHQRVNIKRGDNMVFPTWDQLLNDTGISNRRTLDVAIKELEKAGLIVVDRSYNQDLQRKNVNQYYIVPTTKLSQWQIYKKPVANLQKASGKTATITRTKGTRMNITRMKKGNLRSKKDDKKNHPSPSSFPPKKPTPGAINQKEKGQWQNRTGSDVPMRAAMSADDVRRQQEEWDRKQQRIAEMS